MNNNIRKIKDNIINSLIENEKHIEKVERTFTEDEMNATLDWVMAKYE